MAEAKTDLPDVIYQRSFHSSFSNILEGKTPLFSKYWSLQNRMGVAEKGDSLWPMLVLTT